MKPKSKTITALLGLLVLTSGCAYFRTVQIDDRTDEKAIVRTEATAWTLFSSKSSLASWKAEQTEKTQGAEVGNLTQQGATNTAATIRALEGLLRAIRP